MRAHRNRAAEATATDVAAALVGVVACAAVRLAHAARSAALLRLVHADAVPGGLAAERVDLADRLRARIAARAQRVAFDALIVVALGDTAEASVTDTGAALETGVARRAIVRARLLTDAAVAVAGATIELGVAAGAVGVALPAAHTEIADAGAAVGRNTTHGAVREAAAAGAVRAITRAAGAGEVTAEAVREALLLAEATLAVAGAALGRDVAFLTLGRTLIGALVAGTLQRATLRSHRAGLPDIEARAEANAVGPASAGAALGASATQCADVTAVGRDALPVLTVRAATRGGAFAEGAVVQTLADARAGLANAAAAGAALRARQAIGLTRAAAGAPFTRVSAIARRRRKRVARAAPRSDETDQSENQAKL